MRAAPQFYKDAVVPVTAPRTKVLGAEMLGASVIRSGDSYEDALEHARSLAAHHDWRFLPAFDDPDVIAGQGTAIPERGEMN